MYISRHSRRRIALSLCLLIILETVFPAVAMALTSGPVQPEFEGFQQVSASNLVDPFSGDFSYNIPVCEIGGYPLNLSYASGPGVEEEASWVGLGWTLSPGSVNRTVRGLPDDFKGDEIRREVSIKPDTTIGFGVGSAFEAFGFLGVGVNAGIFYNNYTGWGVEAGFSPTVTIPVTSGGSNTKGLGVGGNFSYNSSTGIGVALRVGISGKTEKEQERSLNLSIGGFNSRQGLKELGWGVSYTKRTGKRWAQSMAFSPGGSIGFASMGYTPVPSLPFFNRSLSFHGTVGPAIVGTHPNVTINGYFVEQFLADKDIRRPAYGSLYYQHAPVSQDNILLDVNKLQNKPYQKTAPAISPVIGAFDLFQVSAHGLSGQFRLHRNDIGSFNEPYNVATTDAKSFGVELGVGNAFHAGLDVNVSSGESRKGRWNSYNEVLQYFPFTHQVSAISSPSQWTYEPAFFRMSDELHMSDTTLQDRVHREKPARVKLDRYGATIVKASRAMVAETNLRIAAEKAVNTNVVNPSARPVRNTNIAYLTHEEVEMQGKYPPIFAFPFNAFTATGCVPDTLAASRIYRLSYPNHHISEITLTQNTGQTFRFGLPVYNHTQQDVVFSVQSPGSHPASGMARYTSGTTGDNSVSNNRGREGYFNRETLPAHATSYLLTGIYSADYVDRTGDGVTADDLGNAVQFNYSRTAGYRWRNPVSVVNDSARYNAGYRSDSQDDKASYVYGERDNWYVHSIESPTEVARFYTSNRTDGLGVNGDRGMRDLTQTLKKLDSIVVFSRSDLALHGSSAVPQKTVVFEYETSTTNSLNLAKGIPNTSNVNRGKLVLKAVYTKYKVNQTKYNHYSFVYHTSFVQGTTQYYNYTPNSTDRWGNFRVNNPATYPYAQDFPYVYQDIAHATISANAFNLREITLPSGGIITIAYESDDYAFVQDKRAGQMMFIKGFTAESNNTLVNTLYSSVNTIHPYVVIDLPVPVPLAAVRQRYFEDVDQIYFNCWVNLDGKGNSEYVSGYLNYDINDIQTFSTNGSGEATAIKIRVFHLDTDTNEKIHPITKAATQMLRLELQQLIKPRIQAANPLDAIRKAVFGVFDEVVVMFAGFDRHAVLRQYGKTVTPEKSWIRLANPTYKKLGGGSRVKSVQLSDRWAQMTTGTTTTDHIQEFFYETEHIVNGVKQMISSGVASWEPALGGDENLHRSPLPYKEEILLAADNYYYMENPMAESLYPAPSVGYSEVKVRNKTARANNSSNGYSVYKYYTARDFPTKSYMTAKARISLRPKPILKFFGFANTDHEHASQGFVVETNDMHGKPREEAEYNEQGDLLTSTLFEYRTAPGDDGRMRLDNQVNVLQKNGSTTAGTLGLTVDTWQDFSEEENKTRSIGVAVNTEGFFAFLPFIIPVAIPIYQQSHLMLRTAATTKKVHRSGILSRVTRMQYGSTLATENLYYDAHSGEVLIQRTENEFGKHHFHTVYPAHWGYADLDFASRKQGIFIEGVPVSSNGQISNTSVANSLVRGDELIVYRYITNGTQTINVPYSGTYFVGTSGTNRFIINEAGRTLPAGSYSIKIVRPANENQYNVPLYQYTSLVNPMVLGLNSLSNQITDVRGITMKQDWQIDEVWPKRRECTTDTVGKADLFFKDTLLQALMVRDTFWAKSAADSLTVYSVVSSVFSVSPTKVWRGRPINTIPFFRISPPVGQQNDLYPVYIARIGENCSLEIRPWQCEGSLKGERSSQEQQAMTSSLNCNLVPPNILLHGSCAFHPPQGVTLVAGDPVECYYYAYMICRTCQEIEGCQTLIQDSIINPFTAGLLGRWGTDREFVRHTNRHSAHATNTTVRVRDDGYISNLSPHLWSFTSANTLSAVGTSDVSWIPTSTQTKVNSRMKTIESIDAMGVPHASIIGYKDNVVKATAANALLRNIAMECFEDWNYRTDCRDSVCYLDPHFDFFSSGHVSMRSDEFAHTGRYSLKVPSGSFARECRIIPNYTESGAKFANRTSPTHGYIMKNPGKLPKFYPEASTYVASVWIRKASSGATPTLTVRLNNTACCASSGSSVVLSPSGPVIDGWQRISGTFTVSGSQPCPGTTSSIDFTFATSNGITYFDDFRVHPLLSTMQTHVYDHTNLRISATLDENNYATFYEYDDMGNLIRIKRETERGVMTIQEGAKRMTRDQ